MTDESFPPTLSPSTGAPPPQSQPIDPASSTGVERPTPTGSEMEARHALEDQARLNRLLRIFFGLSTLLLLGLLVPYFAGRIQYSLTAAKERAEADVARENMRDFQLSQQVESYTILPQVVRPSVVSIRTNRRTRMGNGQGQGSGVIVDKEGYILTNEHVVRGVNSVDIELSDGRTGSGSVIGIDPDLDLAVVKTELGDLTPAAWGNSEDLEVGEPVWAFGSPFGLKQTVTSGIVSAKKRRG
ncbi:MAG: trypsin-like peptidase domain-containing protein, partial [Lacipirellulaceae bacterium]